MSYSSIRNPKSHNWHIIFQESTLKDIFECHLHEYYYYYFFKKSYNCMVMDIICLSALYILHEIIWNFNLHIKGLLIWFCLPNVHYNKFHYESLLLQMFIMCSCWTHTLCVKRTGFSLLWLMNEKWPCRGCDGAFFEWLLWDCNWIGKFIFCWWTLRGYKRELKWGILRLFRIFHLKIRGCS